MKFDSEDTKRYFHNKLKKYGRINVSPKPDMVWTKEKVDNFFRDLMHLEKRNIPLYVYFKTYLK